MSETANHVQGAAKAFNGQADTYSETASKAFRNAKDQNGVPKSQQPDRTIKPNTEAGNAAGLRDDNVVQYEFTNSKGEKVIIRQDKTTTYPDGGVQPPHYNTGKSSDNKLKNTTIIMNTIKPYEIKEIYTGHYFMVLDMLDVSDFLKIISDEYKYLWFFNKSACYGEALTLTTR